MCVYIVYVYVYIYICVCICIYICMYVYMYIYIYIYICVCISLYPPALPLYFLYCHLFIIAYQLSFYLWQNETVLKRSKDSKYYD